MGHHDQQLLGIQVGGLLGLVVLTLDIWAIIKVCRSGQPALIVTLWSLLIIFFPVFGLLLYLCCGPPDMMTYVIIV